MNESSTDFIDVQAALAGEYSLQRELGRGGRGVVYLARDVQLDRDVAIKVLPMQHAGNAAERARFLREARTAAGLSHPHIVPIHRVGEAGDVVYFVMSYVEGETLGERLRARGTLAPTEAMRILREVAWALAYAHGRGVIHGDVNADNILLEAGTGRALVTDFGITHDGDDPVDGSRDLHALGVVGQLAVSGAQPFDATNLAVRAAPGIPQSLAAVIERSLARDPAARFPDGETMAAALEPTAETRPALTPMLRAWLAARNVLVVPYLGWSAGFSVLTLGNFIAWLSGNPGSSMSDFMILATATSLPIFPIIGYHLHQARRQFRAGHTLADLRSAIEIDQRERAESDAVVREEEQSLVRRALRASTVGSATLLAITSGLIIQGAIHENNVATILLIAPVFSTMLLGAVSNALDVQFIPTGVRTWWQTGIRDRLWKSRAGEWLARKLGAPERSNVAGELAFRATEASLGVAASELFDLLPQTYRDRLVELPATVDALEAHAARARAELDVIATLATSSTDAEVLSARRDRAKAHLADSVAALETIRLDLLRLHANANDLGPLSTLLEKARIVGDEVNRLADAQSEVEAAIAKRT